MKLCMNVLCGFSMADESFGFDSLRIVAAIGIFHEFQIVIW